MLFSWFKKHLLRKMVRVVSTINIRNLATVTWTMYG